MTDAPAWWYETGPDTVAFGLKMRLVYRETTPHQELEIYEHDVLGRVLVLDGILQTTQHDEFIYHEMLAHVPLLGRPPGGDAGGLSVLIIGGGDGGTLREVLRHPFVERVVLVEIDEAVVRAAAAFLDFGVDFDDPRLALRFEDAAAYVASDAARAAPFDALLIDSTDPVGPGEVLFTPAFLEDARACLRPGGVLARHLCMPHYQPEVLSTGARRLRAAFANAQIYQAAIPSYLGAAMAFAAATKEGTAVSVPHRSFTGRHYNPDVHRAAFALPTWWQAHIQPSSAR